jgi:hypothetical protein
VDRKIVIKAYFWLSLGLALVGTALIEAKIRSQQGDFVLPMVLVSVGLFGMLVSEIARRKTTARVILQEERKARDEWFGRGVLVDMNMTFFVFASGLVVEFFSFDQLQYRIVAVTVYLLTSCFVYFTRRKSIITFQWDYVFHFALVFALPAAAVAWKRPEILGEVGFSQIQTSREISVLAFLFVQAGLLLSTAMTASRGWRTSFLMKRGLSVKNLQTLQATYLSRIRDEKRRDLFREIVSDMAILRESLIYGQFQTTVALSWSTIDRMLSQLSRKEKMKEKAKELCVLTSDFEKCYETRNKAVHAGYRPTYDDAFDCVQLLRTIMVELSVRLE